MGEKMKKEIDSNTPVMKQFLDVKDKYNDSIVLFRMGDFYETFLNDAILTSQILGIVLTKEQMEKQQMLTLRDFRIML